MLQAVFAALALPTPERRELLAVYGNYVGPNWCGGRAVPEGPMCDYSVIPVNCIDTHVLARMISAAAKRGLRSVPRRVSPSSCSALTPARLRS